MNDAETINAYAPILIALFAAITSIVTAYFTYRQGKAATEAKKAAEDAKKASSAAQEMASIAVDMQTADLNRRQGLD